MQLKDTKLSSALMTALSTGRYGQPTWDSEYLPNGLPEMLVIRSISRPNKWQKHTMFEFYLIIETIICSKWIVSEKSASWSDRSDWSVWLACFPFYFHKKRCLQTACFCVLSLQLTQWDTRLSGRGWSGRNITAMTAMLCKGQSNIQFNDTVLELKE